MDIEVDYLKMEDVIANVKHEVLVLQVKEKSINRELEDMKNKSAGTFFWPKSIIHPMLNNKFETYILVKPCGFCNRGYHCHDIGITFYKHTFHPFCFKKILKLATNVLFVHKCSILIDGIVGAFGKRMRMSKSWLWICVWMSCELR